ncbi:MAG: thioredoxin family protein [Ardenticatenales bacterium]|nr:thioredoxin family protein [Ardenticatenales bacterium]
MTPELFYAGLTWDDYAASMQVNRELLRRKCREFTLPEGERGRWANSPIAHVLVFTEDWCQDSISALPPLLALHATTLFDLRVLRRSEALELQRALTGQLFPPVPMFVFYDNHWQERGRFVEMPRAFRRLKTDPAEALWLKEMYDEMWWETELAEFAIMVDHDGE